MRWLLVSSNETDLVADFFCGSGTTLAVAEKNKRQWIGCDFSKVAISISRNRLVTSRAKPFLLENIGNYQRQMIYLSGARIQEMQRIVLKLYGATPRKDYPELGVRKDELGDEELIYVSYPDRPITAKKVAELEELAETLDGRGYQYLVILGWDYEYNYDEILHERQKTSKRVWKTQVKPKTIPPEVYEYLRQAQTEAEIESFQDKIKFYDKPFLKLSIPEVTKRSPEAEITIGIDKYVVFDYPIEDDKQRQELMELVKSDPLVLIDYWAVDWDYDGVTFKSSWQAFRQHGRKATKVPRTATQTVESGNKREIAVRVVDVFGNDATSTLTIDIR